MSFFFSLPLTETVPVNDVLFKLSHSFPYILFSLSLSFLAVIVLVFLFLFFPVSLFPTVPPAQVPLAPNFLLPVAFPLSSVLSSFLFLVLRLFPVHLHLHLPFLLVFSMSTVSMSNHIKNHHMSFDTFRSGRALRQSATLAAKPVHFILCPNPMVTAQED